MSCSIWRMNSKFWMFCPAHIQSFLIAGLLRTSHRTSHRKTVSKVWKFLYPQTDNADKNRINCYVFNLHILLPHLFNLKSQNPVRSVLLSIKIYTKTTISPSATLLTRSWLDNNIILFVDRSWLTRSYILHDFNWDSWDDLLWRLCVEIASPKFHLESNKHSSKVDSIHNGTQLEM